MRKILYELGLLLLGVSIWSVTWEWLGWDLLGVLHRIAYFIAGCILISISADKR